MKSNTSNIASPKLPPQPWGTDAARIVIDELNRTDFSVSRFAQYHKVSAYKVRRCQRLVDEADSGTAVVNPSLLSVRIKESAPAEAAAVSTMFEIKTASGLLLRFPQNFCPTSLARIMSCLMEVSC